MQVGLKPQSMKNKLVYVHGAMILLLYFLVKWIPISRSADKEHTGEYKVRKYRVDDDASMAAETTFRFQNSGINTFLSTLKEVLQPKAKQIVLVCFVGKFGLCGGIGDRIRGIPYAVALAHLSGRQLILHRSLLGNGPFDKNSTIEGHYNFVDGSCTNENVEKLMRSDAEILSVTVNCPALEPSAFSSQHSHLIGLQTIFRECLISYLCGAAAIHQTNIFKEGLDLAGRLVAAMPMWQYRNYTALHVRAGGSVLKIDSDYTAKALWWDDGYASDVPQDWIDVFKESTSSIQCGKHLAIVSDSVRLVSELQFTARDWLMITRCCSQPLHRDRSQRQGFFLQEIIDLFILARSRRIIAGGGGFAVLGRYWLGRDGPAIEIANSKEDIRNQMEIIRLESDCETKN